MNPKRLRGKTIIVAILLLALLILGPVVLAARPIADYPSADSPRAPAMPQETDGSLSLQDIEILVEELPSSDEALARLEAGELDVYSYNTSHPELAEQIEASPDLDGYRSYFCYNELTFNPSGPVFDGTGKLNPFAVPRVRQAMNWLVDRDHIAEQVLGGMAVPRWHALNTASRDYNDLADVARSLELEYAHNKDLAQQVIAQEMLALGATLEAGLWHYNGEPVEIILLIRPEDERKEIGDYTADQLEDVGFTTIRDYKTSREAAPIWISGNPADGLFHIYTGGWTATAVPRNLADSFAHFYTDMGLPFPLWQAYENTPEFYELTRQLKESEFATLEERRAMMAQALEWALEDSHRIWLTDGQTITPRRAEVSYASDLYGGMVRSWLWPHTLQREGDTDGQFTVGTPSILWGPWNPLDGTNWLYDMQFIRATGEMGYMPDPYTGLWWPNRFAHAEVVAQEGLPIFSTLDWVDLAYADEIVVPDDAWVDWDAETQRFLTAKEIYPEAETALRKSVVYYPADLFDTVTWHDGSAFSIGDVVMGMILTFDRAQPESPVYDESKVSAYNAFTSSFKGMRIVSQEPLIIEHYSDSYQLDAERSISTWWPYYSQGQGAWHNLTLGLMAEEAEVAAFSGWKADDLGVEWLNYIDGPSLGILAGQLGTAQLDDYIPYAPTMEDYVDQGQAAERWDNLEQWYTDRGHFWIGTGPLFLEDVAVDVGKLSLTSYAGHPDTPDRWDGFTQPPVADVSVEGPESFERGDEVVYDVEITLDGEAYPNDDIEAVRYTVLDSKNQVRLSGDATPVATTGGRLSDIGTMANTDGLWRVVLDAEMTRQLPPGPSQIEIAVISKRIAIPSFASQPFTGPSGNIIYVSHDAIGNNDGSSWANAYTDLQDALGTAQSGDEIWVAQGVYYPAPTAVDRTATFELQDGVGLYGGFAGIENQRHERDWVANVTVLSGDLDRNDTTDDMGVVTDTVGIMGRNAYHVLTANGVGDTTVLDGFTVSAGLADGADEQGNGGGMWSWYYSEPTLRNVSFVGNAATKCGGGMYSYLSTANLTLVTFSGNWADEGGGMYGRHSNPDLRLVTFNRNEAYWIGGGMYVWGGSGTLTDVVFSGNSAKYGGGMNNLQASPTLTDVSFNDNRAEHGGGLRNAVKSSPEMTDVTFSNNAATHGGGVNNEDSDPMLTNVTFTGNRADGAGGGMCNSQSSSPTLTNVAFSGNWANNGGGMYNQGGGANLVNATLAGNQAQSMGGAIYNDDSSPVLANCILWGNGAPTSLQIHHEGTSAPYVVYSNIEGGYPGQGNIDADPLFVDPMDASQAPTTAGDYRLTEGSPAIDAGTNDTVTVDTDLDGNPRIVDGTGDGNAIVDMGAYEFQIPLLTVTKEGQGLVTSTPTGIDCGTVCTAGFLPGTVVALTATADPGWTFAAWSGDVESTDNPLELMVEGTTVLTAAFIQEEYMLDVSVVGQGTVTKEPEQEAYHYGDVVTLTAAADPDWTFIGWSGDIDSTDNPLELVLKDDTVIVALFNKRVYLPLVLKNW